MNKLDYPSKEIVKMAREYPVLIEDTVGVNQDYQRLHHHNVLEINMIKSGTGYYMINGERYDFEAGDIFLINNHDLHCAYEIADLVMLVFEFDITWLSGVHRIDPELTDPFTQMGIEFVNRLDRANPHMRALRELLLEIQSVHNGVQPFYRTEVFSGLLKFLALVNRHFRVPRADIAKPTVNNDQLEKIKFVLKKLEEAPEYPWTVRDMAALIFFSTSHFSEVFKKTIGISPMQHLINLRLEKACQLLMDGGTKIVDIALMCGFRSLSNFNRLFKQYMKTEPREYKSR